MSNYTVQVSWSGKDALNTSDPEKIISGDDLATEFTALQTSVNSKVDTTSGTTTGHTLINPIINTGVTGTAVLDEDNMASNSATKLATQQSIKAYSDTHFADTSVHGTSSAVVGVSDTQALTNKTIVAASNTITTAATGNLTSTDLNAALAELQTDVDTKTTLAAATAATAADLVATNQDTIDTAADLVATNQDTIDTAADLVLTNADVVLTHADEVLTRADTVLTAADVVSTAAAAASASASAATASAAAAGIYWKEPVVNRSTANLTLSGEQTIDGILTSTSRILVMNQSSAAENGIYVTASGAWARAVPLNTWDEHVGAVVLVSQGTAYSDQAFMCTVDPGGTLGSTAITWAAFGAVAVNFSVDSFETSTDYTAGTTTTLVITTDAGSEENIRVSFDGVVQHHSTYTYTSGTRTITFDAAIPIGTAEVECQYGSSVGIGTPSDGTVSAVKIASNAVETAKIADNAVTLAKMASGTDGSIISYDSSTNPVLIAPGNDGQVLTSAGAGAQPAFETLPAASQDVVLLSTTDASTASTVDLTGNFTTTYTSYEIKGVDIFTSSSTAALYMQVIFNGTVITGGVYYGHRMIPSRAGSEYAGNATSAGNQFTIINQLSSGSHQGTGFSVNLLNAPATTNSYKFFTWSGMSAEGWTINFGAGGVNDATDSNLTGLRFVTSAGTVSGKFLVYGIK